MVEIVFKWSKKLNVKALVDACILNLKKGVECVITPSEDNVMGQATLTVSLLALFGWMHPLAILV